jgi:hypothetical protein
MVGEVDINWIPEFRSSFCWAGKSVLGGLWQLPFPDDPVSKVSFRLGQFGTAANFSLLLSKNYCNYYYYGRFTKMLS